MKDDFNRYVFTSFGMIFSATIIAVIAFYFLSGDIITRSEAIAATRLQIAKENNSLVAFAEIKEDSTEAAKYKSAMNKLLPTQTELINFPKWLQNVAATYNVTASFSFAANTALATPTSAGTVGFSLTAEGKNEDAFSFLKDLESRAPGFLLSFDSFNLTQSGSDTKIITNGNMFFR